MPSHGYGSLFNARYTPTSNNDIIGILDDLIVRCGLCNGTQSSTTVVNPCRGCTGN